MAKSLALTFSKKNEDAYNKLMDRNTELYKQATDYICDAIRAFNPNDQKLENSEMIDKKEVQKLINESLENFKKDLLNNSLVLSEEKEESESLEYLEQGLETINNIDDD